MSVDRVWTLARRGARLARRIPGMDAALRRLRRYDPAYTRCRERLREVAREDAVLLCVYRAKNHRTVGALVAEAESAGIGCHLWALDRQVAPLSNWTRGVGPGTRTELLNRLWENGAKSDPVQVIVCDDDFVFSTGGLRELVLAVSYCDFGLAQPGHADHSFISHSFTRSETFTVARLTSWVDIGPAFVVRRPWIDRVLPFPPGYGMGWGLGLVWQRLRDEGCRLGIVDAISVQHLHPPYREYDRLPEARRVERLLRERGLQKTADAQACLQRWMCWQSVPKWIA